MNQLRRYFNPYIITVAAFSIIYLAMCCLTPPLEDDIWYDLFNKPYYDNPSLATCIESFVDNIEFRVEEDNGRLGNMLATPLLLLPKWVASVLLALCLAISLIEGAKLIGVWRKSFFAFAVWTICLLYLPPWWNHMTTVDFPWNYLPSMAMTIILARCLIGQIEMRTLPLFLLAFVTGWWHEGNIATIIGGICGISLFFKPYRNRKTLTILVGLLIPLIFFLLIPATTGRFVRSDSHFYDFFNLLSGLKMSVSSYILCIVFLVMLTNRKIRVKFLTPDYALIFGCLAGAMISGRLEPTNPRGFWMMLVFTSLGAAAVINTLVRDEGKALKAVAWSVIALGVVQQVLCLPWYARLHYQYDVAVKAVADNPGKKGLFVPMSSPFDPPVYTLCRPLFYTLIDDGYPFEDVVPEALADFDPAKAKSIGVNGQAWFYKNFIIIPDRSDTEGYRMCYVYQNGRQIWAYCLCSRFETPAGCFVHIMPAYSLFGILSRSLEGFEFQGIKR